MMRFFFDEQRAAQAAARLLDRHGGPMHGAMLVQLLYLADRQTLIETSTPVTGDCFIATRHGPALGRILDLLTWGCPDGGSEWGLRVSPPRDHAVTLIGPTDCDALGAIDVDVLDAIHARFGQRDPWQLAEYTRTLPEWTDPGDGAIRIDPGDILRAAGLSDASIRELAEEAEAVYLFRASLAKIGAELAAEAEAKAAALP